jgi:hypothetical protein
MIRPTTIPQTLEELQLEQAIAREALRLALVQHKKMAIGLKGIQTQRTISDTFDQSATGQTIVNMMNLNLIIGSGGVLSHAPRRQQSALMMIDAFVPEGITMLSVDSIFMMPHLGVLSVLHPQASGEVFEKDCLVRLGTCVAPVGLSKEGKKCFTVLRKDTNESIDVKFGEIKLLPAGVGEKIKVDIIPEKGFDLGIGKNKKLEDVELEGGVVGIILDGRGRPFVLPEDPKERVRKLTEWHKALNIYPEK